MLIYEPNGRAKEYAELACNLAVGCNYNCAYCYGPGAFHVKREDWNKPKYKKDLLKRFEASAKKYEGDPRPILFSFASDPFMDSFALNPILQVLPICERYKLNVQILTKNPLRAFCLCGYTMLKRQWALGTTICFLSEELHNLWEPCTPQIESRIFALKEATKIGIKTWVSIEPVIDVEEALTVITAVKPHADMIKIGKWNHDKRANDIDWADFLRRAKTILGDHPHLIKKDLAKYE